MAEVERAMNDGGTPLHLAAWAGHKELAAILLEHGANVETVDVDGESPSQWAHGSPTRTLTNESVSPLVVRVARLLVRALINGRNKFRITHA